MFIQLQAYSHSFMMQLNRRERERARQCNWTNVVNIVDYDFILFFVWICVLTTLPYVRLKPLASICYFVCIFFVFVIIATAATAAVVTMQFFCSSFIVEFMIFNLGARTPSHKLWVRVEKSLAACSTRFAPLPVDVFAIRPYNHTNTSNAKLHALGLESCLHRFVRLCRPGATNKKKNKKQMWWWRTRAARENTYKNGSICHSRLESVNTMGTKKKRNECAFSRK